MAYDQADPFGPQAVPNPTPEQQAGIAEQWRTWLADKDNRAALMQFGVALMQPVGLGQSPLGHLGSAVGQAGEAIGRRKTEAEKTKELESKQDLRASQAQLAEERALRAGTTANLATERLKLTREGLDLRDQNQKLARLVQLQGLYDKALKEHEGRRIIDQNLGAFPSFEDWIARNPLLSQDLTRPAPSKYKEGDTATGPGGQRMQFRGGKWEGM